MLLFFFLLIDNVVNNFYTWEDKAFNLSFNSVESPLYCNFFLPFLSVILKIGCT